MSSATPHAAPTCVGIIMDGNRRWARAHGLPTFEGHRRGYGKLKDVMGWCKEACIHHLVVYALSTENLQRTEEEVSYLLNLFRETSVELHKAAGENASVHFIGDFSRFPDDIQETIRTANERNTQDVAYHIWVAAPYGGRAELVAAINTLAARGPGPYTETDVADTLWSRGMPDPDLVIRTGGDHRLSNFLPWQSVYAELFFTETQWPAFTKEEFLDIVMRYGARERRYGK